MLLIGVALDLIKASGLFVGTDLYSLAAFKLAFPLQLLVMSIGILMFHRERKLTKAQGEYKRT
jgi:hypothetical protein